MTIYYDNILIPVDRSLNTQKAVSKALELTKPWQTTTIHLLQLIYTWNPFTIFRPAYALEGMPGDADVDKYIYALLDLMRWKKLIESKDRDIVVKIHIRQGCSLQSSILRIARKERTALVILASDPKRKSFSIRNNISAGALAQRTGSRILSLRTDVHERCTEEAETFYHPLLSMGRQAGFGRLTRPVLKTFQSLFSHN